MNSAPSGHIHEASRGFPIVAAQECRDLWLSGRGLWLLVAHSLILSTVTYLAATNTALNFLEQREAVNLTLQVAVAVGALVALVVSADGISGERERGTLESLLLTPVSRRSIVAGKLVAALSLWLAAFVVSIPYVWVLGRGVAIVARALTLGLLVGTVIAVGLAALGLLVSALSTSNKASLAVSFVLLLALFAPSQLPSGLPQGWFGELVGRVNPVGAGLHYINALLVSGHAWSRDLSFLVAPIVTALIFGGVLAVIAPRIVRLHGGVSPE